LNTTFIERVNLTVRHGVAALARRTWATSQQASGQFGMVASVLSFCAPPCLAADSAPAASRTRWQTSSATLPPAYPSHGSGQNQPTMDGARGALLPLAKDFRLSATQARCGCLVMAWSGGGWVGRRSRRSLVSGSGGLPWLSTNANPARHTFAGLVKFSTISYGAPLLVAVPSEENTDCLLNVHFLLKKRNLNRKLDIFIKSQLPRLPLRLPFSSFSSILTTDVLMCIFHVTSLKEAAFLQLHYGGDFTYEEIGQVFGMRSEAVRKRVARSVEKFRATYGKGPKRKRGG